MGLSLSKEVVLTPAHTEDQDWVAVQVVEHVADAREGRGALLSEEGSYKGECMTAD